MSDDGYKVQVSVKFGPMQAGMLNVRANTVPELDALLEEAGDLLVARMAGVVEGLAALATIGQVFPATAVIPAQAQPQGSSGGGYSMPAGEMCQHGAMAFKEGPDWKGYFCPTQKGDPTKCKPRYIR